MMIHDLRHTSRPAAANNQRACAWCGPLLIVCCALGMAIFARFAPPPSPSDTPAEIAETLKDDTTGIRVGMMLMVIGAALLGPFVAVISAHLRRIEGPRPTLSYLQLALGTCFVVEIIFPLMAVQTAAFRPNRDEVIQQALTDYGFLTFFGVASTAALQMIIIGVVILQDTRPSPVFPRWSAYLNFWVGLSFTPGTFTVFFKSGPIAWSGVFCFWIPFAAFFVWLVVMTYLLFRAIDGETAEDGARAGDPADGLDALTHQLAALTEELHSMHGRLARLENPAVPGGPA